MSAKRADRERLVQHQHGAVLFLERNELLQRRDGTSALVDAFGNDEGPAPLGLVASLGWFPGKGRLDRAHVVVRHPDELRLAQTQPRADAKMDLAVDDDAVVRLHQGWNNAGGRHRPRRIIDRGLSTQELRDRRLELQVRHCRTIETAGAAGSETIDVHCGLDRLQRGRRWPLCVAERVEQSEFAILARLHSGDGAQAGQVERRSPP
mmetsp:Transcript_84868/g.236793  ORF Transcript_84868/g.236793 Transcript_84868/m.236793 type:complete len:207 (+) Transcript_84868:696-1316(+)